MDKLRDYEKATMILYILNEGLPDWAGGSIDATLARLMDWPLDRATEAFNKAEQEGLISRVTSHESTLNVFTTGGSEIVQ